MSGLLKRKSIKGKSVDLSGKKLNSLGERLKTDPAVDALDASNNFLRSVPFVEVLASYVNLASLDLSKNALTNLGAEIGLLVNLTRLNVSHNALTTLPAEIGQLTRLRKLFAGRNALRSLPSEMVGLRELTVLQLHDNALVELPTWLLELRDTLKELSFDGNPLLAPSLLHIGRDAGTTPLFWSSLERLAALRDLHYERERFKLTPTARTSFCERLASDPRWMRLYEPILNDKDASIFFEVSYSISQQQNWRAYQEDRFVCIPQVDVRDVMSDRVLPPYYPPLWDDVQALYEKELAIHNAIMEEYEREARGENVELEKERWLKEREKQRKDALRARKEGIVEEHDEEKSIEEQLSFITKVEGWHRLHLAPQYPLHLDARSHSPWSPSEEKSSEEHSDDRDAIAFFAVYDGHGGDHCSDYLQHNLHVHLFNNKELVRSGQWSKALTEAFAECERLFLAECRARNFTSGSTACVALLVNSQLWVANCGDSRAVLCRRDKAMALSRDHKPTLKDERKRIEDAGGFVENSSKSGYTARVQGILAMSRSIGDIQCKEPIPAVSAEPEITETLLGPDDSFILIASDGLFDAMSNQDAVDYVRKSTERHRVAQELAERALKDSRDNVTVMVIWLFWSVKGLTYHLTSGTASSSSGIVLGQDRVKSDVLHKRARSTSELHPTSGSVAKSSKGKEKKGLAVSDRGKDSDKDPLHSQEEGLGAPTAHVSDADPQDASQSHQHSLPSESVKEQDNLLPGNMERSHSMGSLNHSKSRSPSKERKRTVLVTSGSKSHKDSTSSGSSTNQDTREKGNSKTGTS